jgi:hypothetical protein
VNDKQISVHWSELPADDLTRFWQDVDAGTQDNFLVAPVKKRTRRTRGEHSTKAKCENPSWFRPEHYKKLSGELGHAYNRLVMFDKATGQPGLRTHISRHPLYVAGRRKAGRKYGFRPERQRLNDALWPCSSASAMAESTLSACVSRVWQELSPKTPRATSFRKRR